jgi:hypothetical protein
MYEHVRKKAGRSREVPLRHLRCARGFFLRPKFAMLNKQED